MNDVTTIAMSPVILLQALWLSVRAQRLPEAAGARTGVAGRGPLCRLLVLGDSSAAGVGVATQDEALAGHTARFLAETFETHWTLSAASGATTASALKLMEGLPRTRFDAAVIALGVNDGKNGVPRKAWRRNYAEIAARLEQRHGVRTIVASGLPPVRLLPSLPEPLRDALGKRYDGLDHDLRELAARSRTVEHLPMDFATDPRLMATDGLHPGPVLYGMWAERVADVIRLRMG